MDNFAFTKESLQQLKVPQSNSKKTDGQLVVITGSDLFHGPPLFTLEIVTRMVEMVFFTSVEPGFERWADDVKSRLGAFIWVPLEEIEHYLEKADAALIGPGMKRYGGSVEGHELDEAGRQTKDLSERLLRDFDDLQWVVDAGSLQTIDASTLPKNAIITPNRLEYELMLGPMPQIDELHDVIAREARDRELIITHKMGPHFVTDGDRMAIIEGGNPGMNKGGMGDCLAAVTAALATKNEPLLAASAGLFLNQSTADHLYDHVGPYYSADDLSRALPGHLWRLLRDEI